MKRSGFTLIELLVVLTIIAILSAIGLASYVTFLSESRDAKRQSDLKLIQSALEQYHADQKYYPYSGSVSPDGQLTNVTGAPSGTTLSKTYLNSVPKEPKWQTSPYLYKAYKASGAECVSTDATSCTKYCLYARLENSTQKISTCSDLNDVSGNPYTLEVTSP